MKEVNTLHILVIHNIKDKNLKGRVNRILSEYGFKFKSGVFECFLNKKQLKSLTYQLKAINRNDSQIRIYPLCQSCSNDILFLNTNDEIRKTAHFII